MTRKNIPHDYFSREQILEWAEKSGGMFDHIAWLNRDLLPVFMRFAALVAAAERDRMTVDSMHTCHAECDRPGCVRVREAVKAEREACAEYAAALAEAGWSAGSIADAIRARGET